MSVCLSGKKQTQVKKELASRELLMTITCTTNFITASLHLQPQTTLWYLADKWRTPEEPNVIFVCFFLSFFLCLIDKHVSHTFVKVKHDITMCPFPLSTSTPLTPRHPPPSIPIPLVTPSQWHSVLLDSGRSWGRAPVESYQ